MAEPASGWLPAIFWEFSQNLPLVGGFVLSVEWWQAGKPGWAVAAALAGSTLGALTIRFTESRLVSGHHEPLRVVAVNIMVMAGLMLLFSAYLAAPWSRWWTDVVVGAPAGVSLAVAQDLAAGERIGVAHCLAMASALPLGLVVLRLLSGALPATINVLGITVVLTIVIYVIDYGKVSDRNLPEIQ